MNGRLLIMQLDHQRYALHLSEVVRVVRMVEVTAIPKAGPAVLGVVNVQGEVLPVIDLRRCFGHPPRPVEPQDVLVIVQTGKSRLALAADAVAGVIEHDEGAVGWDRETLGQSELLEGVVKLPGGLVMVCNLGKIGTSCGEAGSGGIAGREGGSAGWNARTTESGGEQVAPGRLKILRERAQKLARAKVAEDGARHLEIVEFTLSGEEYAIESCFIREVYPLKELTPLPCTPPFVLGIVNLRGKILSVIDIRTFFQLPEKGVSQYNKVIILEGGKMEFGILADAIVGVGTIDAGELQPSLPTLTEIRADYLKGVTDRLVVLDAGKMLADKRIVVHEVV